jgi:hypothetical protein
MDGGQDGKLLGAARPLPSATLADSRKAANAGSQPAPSPRAQGECLRQVMKKSQGAKCFGAANRAPDRGATAAKANFTPAGRYSAENARCPPLVISQRIVRQAARGEGQPAMVCPAKAVYPGALAKHINSLRERSVN